MIRSNLQYKTFLPPTGGVHKRRGFQHHQPYTTVDAQNVWPYDSIDGRTRIGSRPGLYDTSATDMGNSVNMLAKLEYIDTGNNNVLTEKIIAAEGGDIFASDNGVTFTQVASGSSLALATDVNIHAQSRNGVLFIADHDNEGPAAAGTNGAVTSGTTFDSSSYTNWNADTSPAINQHDYVVAIDSTGTGGGATVGIYEISSIADASITLSSSPGNETGITFRVIRVPKVYDPIAGTLTRWLSTATKGNVPCGHPCIALYRDRLILAGGQDNPNNWIASRGGDPYDWKESDTDSLAAQSGQGNDAGQIGDHITCLMPHADQCLLIGCRDSTWLMRGDPRFGGQIDALSYDVGPIDKGAITHTADGESVFLTKDGIYMCPKGCGARKVTPVSRTIIPEDILNVDPAAYRVLMAYDLRYRGIHLWIVKQSGASTTDVHYWLNWWPDGKGFWPMTIGNTGYFPDSILSWAPSNYQTDLSGSHSAVFLGGGDGKVRHFSADVARDSSTNITSYCFLGPMMLGGAHHDAKLAEIEATLDTSSGKVNYDIYTANSAEEAHTSTSQTTGTWNKAGRNRTQRPRVRGAVVLVKISNGANNSEWAIESVTIGAMPAGRVRERN
jgi:hypothetical protein